MSIAAFVARNRSFSPSPAGSARDRRSQPVRRDPCHGAQGPAVQAGLHEYHGVVREGLQGVRTGQAQSARRDSRFRRRHVARRPPQVSARTVPRHANANIKFSQRSSVLWGLLSRDHKMADQLSRNWRSHMYQSALRVIYQTSFPVVKSDVAYSRIEIRGLCACGDEADLIVTIKYPKPTSWCKVTAQQAVKAFTALGHQQGVSSDKSILFQVDELSQTGFKRGHRGVEIAATVQDTCLYPADIHGLHAAENQPTCSANLHEMVPKAGTIGLVALSIYLVA